MLYAALVARQSDQGTDPSHLIINDKAWIRKVYKQIFAYARVFQNYFLLPRVIWKRASRFENSGERKCRFR